MSIGFNDRIALEALHCFLRAQDRLAQRMILPEVLGKDFVDEIVGIVFVHLDLFHDDAALAGNVGGIKDGVQNQIAENVERSGNVLVEHLDVEADAFLGGEGVHVAADGVDLPRDFLSSAVLGSFENHVLDEVGDAVPLGIFIARTGLQPDADGGRADMLHLLGDDRSAHWAAFDDGCCGLLWSLLSSVRYDSVTLGTGCGAVLLLF